MQSDRLAEGSGYPPDAFLFLIDAIVAYCRHQLRSLPRRPIKLSAAQVCTAVRDYAGRYFNDHNEARELLGSWKLSRSEDVGSAMRTLIAAGALAVAGCEAEGAFDNIFTATTLFDPLM